MADKKKKPASQSKSPTDSDSSDDNEVNPKFKTSVEERQYNTIPGSAIVTLITLSYSRVQMNSTLERGPPHQKIKVNKPSTDKTCIHIDNSYSTGHYLISALIYKQ